jgi:preprotein translocase subunit SecF/SecD/SecF fusion protein
VTYRKAYFLISSIIVVIGIISLLIFGLNLGIDFSSGTRLDIYIGHAWQDQDANEIFSRAGIGHPDSLSAGGNNGEMAIAAFKGTLNNEQVIKVREAFQAKYGKQVDLQESTVDPTVGRELAIKAIQGVLLASLGIVIYMAIRFEYRFAIAGIIALLHDAFLVITCFSLFHIEVNLPFIAAVLTIVGYSINDTIVIFDRIRENLKTAKIKKLADLEEMVNRSLMQTMRRSINTVLTVLFAAVMLMIFGAESIRTFSLALVIGLIAGAYSSIFLASQIWVSWKGRELNRKRVDAA